MSTLKTNFLQTFLIISILIAMVIASKYSKDANKQKPVVKPSSTGNPKRFDPNAGKQVFPKDGKKKTEDLYSDDNPFRMQKVNLLWQKAKKRLDAHQLTDLFVDLKLQDKLEIETKKKRVENLDKDGEHEAATREQLIEIMKKHGLHDNSADNQIPEENETFKRDDDYNTEKDKWDSHLEKKVDKLWKKAQQAGFSDDELQNLQMEFLHHKLKVDEFNQLKNEINTMDELSENSIEGYKDKHAGLKDRKTKNHELKQHHMSLQEKYSQLEEMTHEKILEKVEFTEPKVQHLWALAQQANFSDIELQTFKEELQHFQHKLQKHEYLQGEISMANEEYIKNGKSNIASKSLKQEHQVKKYGHKVDKIHKELKMRVAKQMGMPHTEL